MPWVCWLVLVVLPVGGVGGEGESASLGQRARSRAAVPNSDPQHADASQGPTSLGLGG